MGAEPRLRALLGVLAIAVWPVAAAGDAGHDHGPSRGSGARGHDQTAAPHEHPPVPPEYAGAHVPSAAWTSRAMIERGRHIYEGKCALCHGARGDGQGPAAAALPLKPPDFRTDMVNEMAGNYWFWRVSEGGQVEPFRSRGSAMPAWKSELSIEDRWAVIAWLHTLSGHRGPHVPSEHPDMPIGPARPEPAGTAPRP